MASELFNKIFHSGTSGSVRTCECGRTYFDGNEHDYDWEEGELEELREGTEKSPGTCVEKDCSIETISVSGKEFVLGCTCGEADKYESFIKSHARQIAKYLNESAEEMELTAKSMKVKSKTDISKEKEAWEWHDAGKMIAEMIPDDEWAEQFWLRTPSVPKSMEDLKNALQADPEYAWSWHCNIAMASHDEGLAIPEANRAAARFMKNCFDVDMTKHEHFKDTQ